MYADIYMYIYIYLLISNSQRLSILGLDSGFLLRGHTLPVVQYVVQVLVLGELHLPPQCVSRRHIALLLHGSLPVPLAVQLEALPQSQGGGAQEPLVLLVLLGAGAVAEVVVLGRERVVGGQLGVGQLIPMLGLPAEGEGVQDGGVPPPRVVVQLLHDLRVVLQFLEVLLGPGVGVAVLVVLADPLGLGPEDGRPAENSIFFILSYLLFIRPAGSVSYSTLSH